MSLHTLQGSSDFPKAELLNNINGILADGNRTGQNIPSSQNNQNNQNNRQNERQKGDSSQTGSASTKQVASGDANRWENLDVHHLEEKVIPDSLEGRDIRLSATDNRSSNNSANQNNSSQQNKNQGNDGRGEVKHPESDRRLKENR